MTTAARTRTGPDLLRAPLLGRFLRWRHARTALQTGMLALAAAVVVDGLFGLQVPQRNAAGVLPWVWWRGFLVLALLVAGNLFCMACPFMLPRRIARRIGPTDRIWPRWLRSKWMAAALLVLFLWAYEAFDLWADPWWTAWIVLAYFAGAFFVDAFFRGAAFCKYVCPIGQFNFVSSLVSPLEVRVRDPEVCAGCRTKDCIRGRREPVPARPAAATAGRLTGPIRTAPDGGLRLAVEASPPPAPGADAGTGAARTVQNGCELWLYQPRKHGNMDCTFCMECIQACPWDNVGIVTRQPGRELWEDPLRSGVGYFGRRPDLAALVLVFLGGAFLNAFGMVPAASRLLAWISSHLGGAGDPVALAFLFLVGTVVAPAGLAAGAARLSRRATGGREPLAAVAARWVWCTVPLAFGMWTAHYLYHLLAAAAGIVPLARSWLARVGLDGGAPVRWAREPLLAEGWTTLLQLGLLELGMLVSVGVAWRIGLREGRGVRRTALRASLPWMALLAALAVSGALLLVQPMEMRGMTHG